ncbi:MAG TPA: hypothetical protein VKV26_13735 [Dehalococcoidia bacterium]|nr:hypothetical protein [Dehalococcoidia bacterium]
MSDSTLRLNDVHEGDRLPPLEKRFELIDVVKWSGATWTFVPIFYDRDLARAQGLPDTLIPGPMKLALFNLLLRQWAGPQVRVRNVRAAYRRPDTPNLPLACHGLVTAVRRGENAGEVDLELWVENVRGERSVTGAATIELPLP